MSSTGTSKAKASALVSIHDDTKGQSTRSSLSLILPCSYTFGLTSDARAIAGFTPADFGDSDSDSDGSAASTILLGSEYDSDFSDTESDVQGQHALASAADTNCQRKGTVISRPERSNMYHLGLPIPYIVVFAPIDDRVYTGGPLFRDVRSRSNLYPTRYLERTKRGGYKDLNAPSVRPKPLNGLEGRLPKSLLKLEDIPLATPSLFARYSSISNKKNPTYLSPKGLTKRELAISSAIGDRHPMDDPYGLGSLAGETYGRDLITVVKPVPGGVALRQRMSLTFDKVRSQCEALGQKFRKKKVVGKSRWEIYDELKASGF